jgi:hypothetical protein
MIWGNLKKAMMETSKHSSSNSEPGIGVSQG